MNISQASETKIETLIPPTKIYNYEMFLLYVMSVGSNKSDSMILSRVVHESLSKKSFSRENLIPEYDGALLQNKIEELAVANSS